MDIEVINACISACSSCPLSKLSLNKENIDKGYGKLKPYYKGGYKNKIMLVGLNPSYRRFPGLTCAFGANIRHNGTGWKFVRLLNDMDLLHDVYITNLIKCSCKNNNPTIESFDDCYEIFNEELKVVTPRVIIALGRKVYDYLKNKVPDNTKLKFVPHPTYWCAYGKISEYQYKMLLSQAIMK